MLQTNYNTRCKETKIIFKNLFEFLQITNHIKKEPGGGPSSLRSLAKKVSIIAKDKYTFYRLVKPYRNLSSPYKPILALQVHRTFRH